MSDLGEVEELNAVFPKAKPPVASKAPVSSVPVQNAPDDLDSSFPKAASPGAVSASSEQPVGAEHPDWNTAMTYGIADAVPFSHDIGAVIQAGESYLPKWAATDDIGETDPNASFGDRYRQQKARIDAIGKSVSRDYPVTSVAAPVVAGGLALPVSGPVSGLAGGLSRVLPGAAAGARTALASGLVGAGYGGLYGAGNGDTLADREHNAATGAIAGGAFGTILPPILNGAAGMAKGALSRLGLTSPEGEAKAAIAAARDPSAQMPASDVQNAINAGQPITVADALGGKQMQRVAEKAAVASPEAEATMRNVIEPRFEQQGERTKAFMQDLFNSDLNPNDIIEGMRNQARIANKTNYDAAFVNPNAKAVWNDGLENLIQSPSVKAAISDTNRVAQEEAVLQREMARANGQPVPADPIVKNPFVTDQSGKLTLPIDPNTGKPSVTPSLQFWDIVKRNLDSMHDSALDNFGKATNQSRLIDGVRKAMISNLDSAVPEYKSARAGAAGFFGESDAFSAGMNYLSKKNALKSAQADAALDALKGSQKTLFAQGVAADLAHKAENANARQNALRQFNDPTTKDKIRKALGPYADRVESYLRVENQMDALRMALGNSRTAHRMTDQSPLGHGVIGAMAQNLGPVGTGAAAGAADSYYQNREHGLDYMDMLKQAGMGAAAGYALKRGADHNRAVQESIARLLMEGDPKKVSDVASIIAQKPGLLSALRGMDRNVSVPISRQAAAPYEQKSDAPKPVRPVRLAPAYAKGGAVKPKLKHEELVARLMSASEKAKNATKRDTKALLGVDDNTVAKALAVAQKAI